MVKGEIRHADWAATIVAQHGDESVDGWVRVPLSLERLRAVAGEPSLRSRGTVKARIEQLALAGLARRDTSGVLWFREPGSTRPGQPGYLAAEAVTSDGEAATGRASAAGGADRGDAGGRLTVLVDLLAWCAASPSVVDDVRAWARRSRSELLGVLAETAGLTGPVTSPETATTTATTSLAGGVTGARSREPLRDPARDEPRGSSDRVLDGMDGWSSRQPSIPSPNAETTPAQPRDQSSRAALPDPRDDPWLPADRNRWTLRLAAAGPDHRPNWQVLSEVLRPYSRGVVDALVDDVTASGLQNPAGALVSRARDRERVIEIWELACTIAGGVDTAAVASERLSGPATWDFDDTPGLGPEETSERAAAVRLALGRAVPDAGGSPRKQ